MSMIGLIEPQDNVIFVINNISDVEEQLPGMLDAIREWYRTYKIPDGKPPNTFGLDEKFITKSMPWVSWKNATTHGRN